MTCGVCPLGSRRVGGLHAHLRHSQDKTGQRNTAIDKTRQGRTGQRNTAIAHSSDWRQSIEDETCVWYVHTRPHANTVCLVYTQHDHMQIRCVWYVHTPHTSTYTQHISGVPHLIFLLKQLHFRSLSIGIHVNLRLSKTPRQRKRDTCVQRTGRRRGREEEEERKKR